MESLEAERDRARELDVDDLADAIESIGFECTRCGACCKGYEPTQADESAAGGDDTVAGEAEVDDAGKPPEREPHTATVFPDEVRALLDAANVDGDVDHEAPSESYDWRDAARPMPYGLHGTADGDVAGETFEWALAVDDCGDCSFYQETDGQGACTVHDDRPLVCRTYPFSVALGGTSQPMGEAVDGEGMVRAHECEGLGREIDREDARELAEALKTRAVREIEEAIGVRDRYDPGVAAEGDAAVVVFDSEGAKRADGRPIEVNPDEE